MKMKCSRSQVCMLQPSATLQLALSQTCTCAGHLCLQSTRFDSKGHGPRLWIYCCAISSLQQQQQQGPVPKLSSSKQHLFGSGTGSMLLLKDVQQVQSSPLPLPLGQYIAQQPASATGAAAASQQQVAAVIEQLSSVYGEEVHKNVQMRLHRNRLKQPTAHTRLWRQLLQKSFSKASSSSSSHSNVDQAVMGNPVPQPLAYDTDCGRTSEGETGPITAQPQQQQCMKQECGKIKV